MTTMNPVKARVKNGRLVLDVPTDLPEGEVVDLVPLGEVLAGGGEDLEPRLVRVVAVGAFASGMPDLGSNPAHLVGFGRS